MSMQSENQCFRCQKHTRLCVCMLIRPSPTRLRILILQHPQEPREPMSSARLAHLALLNSILTIGLSWPNLKTALGQPALPSQWAVLYLGSGIRNAKTFNPIQFVSRMGEPIITPQVMTPQALEGIVLLDGTWTQAKALWWRNPWLLKLKRMILQPSLPSLYGKLRREPRRECLSTIESIAESLSALGEPIEIGMHLKELFSALLAKQRQQSHS